MVARRRWAGNSWSDIPDPADGSEPLEGTLEGTLEADGERLADRRERGSAPPSEVRRRPARPPWGDLALPLS